jgi:hypothetical protein
MMLVLYTLGLSIWDGANAHTTTTDSSSSSSSSSSSASSISAIDIDINDEITLLVAEPLLIPQPAAVL